jgi:ParB family chromosome partitioning protein
MSTAPDRRKALGKGLSALLPSRTGTAAAAAPHPVPVDAVRERTGPVHLPIAEIEPNPQQPRTVFEPDRLEELAQSIRSNGIIQPLIVRHAGNHYERPNSRD